MSSKNHKRISRVLLKYFTSYLLVFILPLLIGMLFLYNNSLKLITNLIEEQNADTLERIVTSLTDQTTELKEIPVQLLATEELFRPYYIKSSQYNVIELMNELDKYDTTNQFIAELGFYIRGDTTLYLSSSTSTLETFTTSRYKFTNYKTKDIYNALNNSTNPTFWPASPASVMGGPSQNVMLYFYPVAPGSLYPYATVFFIIYENDIINSIQNNQYDPAIQNIIITDSSGQVLCSSGDSEYFSLANFDSISQSYHATTDYTNLSKDIPDYSITFNHSPKLEWDFYLITPMEVILTRTNILRQTLFITGTISIVLGLVLVFIMSFYVYKPIRWLGEKTRQLFPSPQKMDEFSLICAGIEKLSIEKLKLSSKIFRNRDAIRQYVLTQYFYGHANFMPSLDEMAADIGIILNHENYCAAIFQISSCENNDNTIDYKNITRFIENDIGKNLETYTTANVHNKQVLVLIAFNQKHYAIENTNIFRSTQLHLIENYGISGSWGIGRKCDSKSGIGRSLVEATAALDYSFLSGDNDIIVYASEINEASVHSLDLSVYIQSMEIAIYQNNPDALDRSINDILTILKESQLPFCIIRCYCYDVLNSILGVNRIIMHNQNENLNVLNSVFTLGQFNSPNDIARIIREVAQSIMINKNKKPKNATLIEQIINYIQDNCYDWNFSVQNIGDEFDMTVSNLSHYFKAKTNCTITTFVHRLRMDKACELLTHTNLSVKDVAAQIGYIDVSSFIKTFKNKYNLTPGRYKIISQKK